VLTIIGFPDFPTILNGMVDPGIDQQLMLSSYLGIILVAAAFLSIGSASRPCSATSSPLFPCYGLLSSFGLDWYPAGHFHGGEIFDY